MKVGRAGWAGWRSTLPELLIQKVGDRDLVETATPVQQKIYSVRNGSEQMVVV